MRTMSLIKYLALPVLILVVAVSYFLLTREPSGSVLLLIFAAAMGVMGWILIPTLDNVGPTAPVDPDFEPPDH
jgi:NADH:ubiquinone oxidoreductase subunit 6 (subunit J)